jgi:hypothetical protein
MFQVVQDVRKFLLATNEIVIMDFHRFPKGFEVTFIVVRFEMEMFCWSIRGLSTSNKSESQNECIKQVVTDLYLYRQKLGELTRIWQQ